MTVIVISLIPTVLALIIAIVVITKVRRKVSGLTSIPGLGGAGGPGFGLAGGADEDKAALAQQLYATGRKARAMITNVQSTGLIINHLNVQCDVSFQLTPLDGSPPFTGQKRMTINQTEMPRVGDVWPAWIDRSDPSVFAVGKPDGASPEQIPLFREFGIPHPLDSSGAVAAPPTWTPPVGAAASGMAPPPPPGPAPAGPPAADAASTSRVAELERLAKLRDQGVLTDAEFQIEKQRILGS